MQGTVAFYTLGCKLNFSETSTISRSFKAAGYIEKTFDEVADVYVINTCSVTENADKKFKTIVKQALKQNPDGFLVAIGCYAQLKPEELASLDGVDLVLGANEKFNVVDFVESKATGAVHACDINQVEQYIGSYAIGERTRAFLKVQDGCDYKCTYCTIPLARGLSRSDTLDNILIQAREIVAQDIREIVLTGVNIGDFGKGEFGAKQHAHTFYDLVAALDDIAGLERIRISSIEPNLLRAETINFVAHSKRFVPHFHIPLQSGSNAILAAMRRRYQRELYAKRVAQIKTRMPHACIGVDVIVGFPGETDAHFMETYHFLNELPVSYLHVFSYSERKDTLAASLPDPVPKAVRAKRSKMLRGLSLKKRRAFYESQLGTTQEVLFESENKSGYIYGFTPNYVKVKAFWNPEWCNTLKQVKLTGIDDDGLVVFELLTQTKTEVI
ncbi:MAG: tRNA (N(6)-L-threonylcarbamoyladenosine(37)-C(2))-methylthiotransferase MtaB [Flavobacteriaceae bacterium]|nr:tRNA (N(6)-L-threonylcarbamoyladenosine(37)-C(2))-methylthiotransferase MtaB [Flavobacteriaceae bacterium]